MNQALEDQIVKMFERLTGLSAADRHVDFQNLDGWDSLRFAQFVIALQDDFGIHFSPSEIAALTNLSAAIQMTLQKKT